ncbi:MAG TPA: serine/threonine-protein kinase, partial [Vicinamibacteria bacterium]
MGLAAGSKFGPYTVDGQLGRGGMASVYKAYEAGLDRYVALKTLPPEFLHDETFAERFHHEAKAVAKLEHPNIVPIYAFGIENGTPWMAMRLVPGGALSSVVKRGRLDPARAVAILKGSAEALAYAHSKHIVHRDVKPQNILLDERERVYLADFGIAKMLESSSKLTATGMINGTPQYMAPEQATATKVDARADIYALGIVAYELLTGRVPFSADTPVAVLMKHVQDQVPLPSREEVKEPLMRALLKALAKRPEDRWPTALDFVAALEAALHELPTAQSLPTLEMTTEMSAPDALTATAVLPPTRPAPTAPTRPPRGGTIAAPPLPARTAAAGAPTVPARGTARNRSTGLALAVGFGGVAALVLAGAVAVWLIRKPPTEASASPSPPPDNALVATHPAVSVPGPVAAATVPPTAAAPALEASDQAPVGPAPRGTPTARRPPPATAGPPTAASL